MDAAEVIAKMHQSGFVLAANGDRLSVSPSDRLTGQQRDFLREHKAELLAALLDAGQAGNDMPPANTLPIPDRLARAAERVCREIHGDDEQAAQEMLDDLATYPPESWPKLIEHFESQLPPDFDNRRTCAKCRNLSAVGYCRQAANMPNATSSWTPDPDRLRRCSWFAPMADDSDQRTDRDRWPGLDRAPGIAPFKQD